MKLEQEAKLALTQKQGETEISDEQMAKHYRFSAVDTMAKKFRTKHENEKYARDAKSETEEEPMQKKPKFLKPADWMQKL